MIGASTGSTRAHVQPQAKVGFVTGAARGLGLAVAKRLAAEGHDIVLLDRCADYETLSSRMPGPQALQEAAELIEHTYGVAALGIRADVASADDMRSAAEAAVARFGRIDTVVCNAGIWVPGTRAWEIPEDQWRAVIDVNLTGVWLTVKYTLPELIRRRAGNIILIASVDGLRGEPGWADYVASKHGVIGLMKALAMEVGEYGVRVNAVCPTWMRTPMVTSTEPTSQGTTSERSRDTTSERESRLDEVLVSEHLLPGIGLIEPEDVAQVIAFLVSPAADKITGCAIPIDAGWIAKRGG